MRDNNDRRSTCDECGVAAQMRHQHEECDSGTGAKNDNRTQHVEILEDQIAHGLCVYMT